ncbi:DEAD/DEAH box helicase [Paenibacillus sabinae]|uniref:Superfamily II DNA/RNA helicase n=1 Tax=Paenibacillus sabinae T27 TaxID=1268072 RepID=X4ZT57_9BACL|nr:DEAD/DEAH box helicase [Paenibacillus sabinae]AHV99640.1 superfamily II DNA/RNA helicase [Paenibacillus sabinae T27]
MNIPLTKQSIKQWCGPYAYQKGGRLCRTNKIHFRRFDTEAHEYTAEVNGGSRHEVQLTFDRNGKPEAVCTCPALGSYDSFCHHIAAVLIRLCDIQLTGDFTAPQIPADSGPGITPGRAEPVPITERILELFDDKPIRPIHNRTLAETRTPLNVEFILKLLDLDQKTALFGIELKAGPKALYIVQNIASFLDQLDRGESYAFSPRFGYSPELHTFGKEDEAVLRALMDMIRDRAAYRKTDRLHSVYASGKSGDRMLLISPQAWAGLLPLLKQAPKVTVMDGDLKYDGVSLSDEPLPLRFELGEAGSGGVSLCVHGLEQITVMEPYGAAFLQGKLLALPAKQGKRLAELKAILGDSGADDILIPGGQMQAFMEKAVPGFMKLGSVRITPAIAEQVTQSPLQAKLYLDRVKDRLLAAVEFQYGEVVINPLEDDRMRQGVPRILIRDMEGERQIIDMIEQCPFTKTEAGYFMNDEEAEFDFLYTVVPQLEKQMKVYATTAVKLRVHKLNTLPKVSVQVSAAERMNWLEFRLNMGWIPETEIRGLVKSLEEKRRYYRLPNGSLLPLDSAELQEMSRFLKDTGLLSTDIIESKIQVPLTRSLHLIDHEFGGLKLDKPVRQLLYNLRNPDNLDFPVPDSFTKVLRDYQITGYQWLKTLAHYGFGGILADDMGLGKTVQSIAFITSVLPEIRQRRIPALVISPGSLVYNWRNELRKFAPGIRVLIADGTQTERAEKMQKLEDADVVLTSYPLLLRDAKLYARQPFHTLILDEAQAFKNDATQTARAVKSIPADYRFALTGTPVENRIEELWSIFSVVFPALFPDRKTFGNLTRKEVAKRARPFMLRRWKSDVLEDLPDKTESIKPAELLPEQKKLYAAYLAKLQQDTLKHLSVDGYHKSKIKILAGLTRLRQICCHPALFIEGYKGGSAKLTQLMEIVEEGLANRKRMLIFSQFTEMLGLIGRALSGQGIPFFYLDGSTPARERVELCGRFNDGEMDIFLISLKAGGTGLNLTGADTVILYDLWWNPAVEQQAADRAHRIGQKNAVQVIRLITQDTMEEKMYELQHRKKLLIDEVMGPGQEEGASALTEEELREILMI